MTSYLLDTCVLSEFTRPKPHPGVVEWMSSVTSPQRLYLSSITIGEIERGIAKLGATAKAKRLQLWLDTDVQAWFADRILSFDVACARTWGRRMALCDQNGMPRAALDSQIAAIALTHGLTLVTRNVSDMEGMGVQLFNPWQSAGCD